MKKIYFKDNGQDLLWIVIDESDIIADCNMQKSVWCGLRVMTEILQVGKLIVMFDDDGNINEYDFEVEKIELVK